MKSEEMESLNNNAKKNQDDVEDFLSNISHELRTPVNVIGGMTALISKDIDSKEYQNLREANIRLAHQIDDIQDYTEVRRDELILMENDYMCDSLISDVVTYYKSIRKNKDLELIVDIAPDTPSILRGDIEKLHKIFRHLIDNAIKYTNAPGDIKVEVKSDSDWVIFSVADTGIRIAVSEQKNIFNDFYRVGDEMTRSTKGSGLGLATVKRVAETHKATISLVSKPGKGSTFTVKFKKAE
jgi:signal transduction histidine kinase